MFSKRGIDYLAGTILLLVVVTVVATIITDPLAPNSYQGEPRELLTRILDSRTQFITNLSLDIFSSFLAIPLAAALYSAFRAHERTWALLGTAGFLAAGVLFLVADMALIALDSMAQDFVTASGGPANAILSVTGAIAAVVDSARGMGALGIALGILSYGVLVMKTGALPRWIGAVGILGGIVTPFGWLSLLQVNLVIIAIVGLNIALLFALLSGIWLVWKGSNEAG
ncbi:MAG: DUF4386 domain-containing protein [Dehalococcoidia bacterium]